MLRSDYCYVTSDLFNKSLFFYLYFMGNSVLDILTAQVTGLRKDKIVTPAVSTKGVVDRPSNQHHLPITSCASSNSSSSLELPSDAVELS
jgi:hypothetical protein